MNDDILEATDSITETTTSTSTMPADAPATLPEGAAIEPQSVPEAAPATSLEADIAQAASDMTAFKKGAMSYLSDSEMFKQRDLMGKVADLVRVRHELEGLRDKKKASAAAFSEKEKALDATIGTLVDAIDKLTWVVTLDEDNGIVYRTNRITGESTSQAYEPPKQRELSLDDPDDAHQDPQRTARPPSNPVEEATEQQQEVAATEPDNKTSLRGRMLDLMLSDPEHGWSKAELAKELSVEPKEVNEALKASMVEMEVEMRGMKRGTKYYPAAGLIAQLDKDRCDQDSKQTKVSALVRSVMEALPKLWFSAVELSRDTTSQITDVEASLEMLMLAGVIEEMMYGETHVYRMKGGGFTEDDTAPTTVQNRIRWYMSDYEWLSMRDIMECLGLEEETVRAALAVLVEDGDVESSGTDKDSDRIFRVVGR